MVVAIIPKPTGFFNDISSETSINCENSLPVIAGGSRTDFTVVIGSFFGLEDLSVWLSVGFVFRLSSVGRATGPLGIPVFLLFFSGGFRLRAGLVPDLS